MTRSLALLLAGTIASLPFGARAEDPRLRVAVLDLKATGKLDAAQVEGLSALIASEFDNASDAEVISGADIRAMVGFEKQRQMLGCSDAGCLAEIGGALGVDYIVGSEASQVGSTYLFSLALVDVRRSSVVRRLTRTTDSDDDLVGEARSGVRELAAALPERKVQAAAGQTAKAEPRSMLPSLLSFGGAAVTAGVGTVLLLGALSDRDEYEDGTDSTPTLTEPASQELRDGAESSAVTSYVLLGGAAALAVLGVVLLPAAEAPVLSVAPSSRGGLVLGAAGRF